MMAISIPAPGTLWPEPVDSYGNPLSGDRIINCCFPDCGCDGARLCMAEKGASSVASSMNIERGSCAHAADDLLAELEKKQ